MDSLARTGPDSEVRAVVVPAGSLEKLISDLASVLADGRALYFSLSPKGALLSVKAPELFAFGESFGERWGCMSPRQRAEVVVDWIRKAARYSREPRVRQSWTHEAEVP